MRGSFVLAIGLGLGLALGIAAPSYAQSPGQVVAPQTLTTLGNGHADAMHKAAEQALARKKAKSVRAEAVVAPSNDSH